MGAFAKGIVWMLALWQSGGEPWPDSAAMQPAQLAALVKSGTAPRVISVAFPVLYRNKHIPLALDAKAGSTPEGLSELKRLVAGVSKDDDLVIYCGCCPMVKCPNIRPAYRALRDMGYTRVRVLQIPTNMHDDWFVKGYPASN